MLLTYSHAHRRHSNCGDNGAHIAYFVNHGFYVNRSVKHFTFLSSETRSVLIWTAYYIHYLLSSPKYYIFSFIECKWLSHHEDCKLFQPVNAQIGLGKIFSRLLSIIQNSTPQYIISDIESRTDPLMRLRRNYLQTGDLISRIFTLLHDKRALVGAKFAGNISSF